MKECGKISGFDPFSLSSCNYGDGPAINSQVNALMRQYLAGELGWQQQGLYGWKKP